MGAESYALIDLRIRVPALTVPRALSMASNITLEQESSVNDPGLNSGYDSGGNEFAEKCWTSGTILTAPNGARQHDAWCARLPPAELGERVAQYHIGLFASPNPDSSLSVSPSSESVSGRNLITVHGNGCAVE